MTTPSPRISHELRTFFVALGDLTNDNNSTETLLALGARFEHGRWWYRGLALSRQARHAVAAALVARAFEWVVVDGWRLCDGLAIAGVAAHVQNVAKAREGEVDDVRTLPAALAIVAATARAGAARRVADSMPDWLAMRTDLSLVARRVLVAVHELGADAVSPRRLAFTVGVPECRIVPALRELAGAGLLVALPHPHALELRLVLPDAVEETPAGNVDEALDAQRALRLALGGASRGAA